MECTEDICYYSEVISKVYKVQYLCASDFLNQTKTNTTDDRNNPRATPQANQPPLGNALCYSNKKCLTNR